MDFFTWILNTKSGWFVLFLALFLFLGLLHSIVEHLAEKNSVKKSSVVKVLTIIAIGTIAAILAAPLLWFLALVKETSRQWKKGIESQRINSINKR